MRVSDGTWGKLRSRREELMEIGNEMCGPDLDSWRETGAPRLWEKQSGGGQDLEHQVRETGRRLQWGMEGNKAD